MQHITPPDLSASQLRQVDDLCNAFEMAFQAGKSPRAEDFLVNADETLRRALLPELLNLELHYRPDCSRHELAERFPELEQTWLDGITGSTDENEFPSIPGYYIMEELGRGGMGVVYLAADLTLHRKVALKMLHRSSKISADHRRRFLGEARAAARLHHPNLVQIFDSGEFEGHPFLVFELVEGGTLAQRLQKRPLTFDESAELMETLCRALQFAHDRHIIHRDLKPSNILLGIDGVPRITDFGLAKRLDEDAKQTISGQVIGTPSYMAPEQAAGLSSASTPAVDIYSLGSILYELLTGRPPFRAASVMETLEQLRTTEPIPPRRVRNDVPRDLETICLKCLHKEPGRRYISADLVANEIGRFRRGESIVARPAGPITRAGRWCVRHPLPASLSAALILMTVVGFAGIWSQWQEAVVQQKRAEMNAAKFEAQRDVALNAIAEIENQRRIAEKHRDTADSRFRLAQAPVQELIRLGYELVRQPRMEARGRQALEKATAFRQELLKEESDDPKVRYDTASALHMLAWTLLEHGVFVEAEVTYSQALELLKGVHAEDSQNPQYLRLLRSVCLERGVTLRHLQRLEESEQSGRDSVLYAEEMLATGKHTATDQIGLGTALTNWSGELMAIGKRDEAVQAVQRSVDIHRKVTAAYPRMESYQQSLALTLTSLSGHLWSTDREAAVAADEEGIEIYRSLVAKAQSPRDEAMYLIRSLNHLADRYLALGRIEDAEQLVTEATGHAQSVRSSFPAFFGVRKHYISTLDCALKLAGKQNDPDRAEAVLNEIQQELKTAVQEFPDDITMKRWEAFYRSRRATLLAERGETEEAMTLMTSSLNDLRRLQSESSSHEQFRPDIITVARAITKVGLRSDFERQKQEAARESVIQDPENAWAHNSLAWHLVCVHDESLRDAIAAEQFVRRAIELKADQAFFHNTLGTALYYQNRLDDAAVEFERSLALQTSQPLADWCFLAMIQHRHGNADQAKALMEKAETWQNEHQSEDEDLLLILKEACRLCGSAASLDD